MSEAAVLTVPFQGLFSESRTSSVGTGTTTRNSLVKLYWYIERLVHETTTKQALNNNFVPSGMQQPIAPEKVIIEYTPEPALYRNKVLPQIERLEKALDRGDKLRKENQHNRAEIHYKTALDLDEANIRANFGIGMVYIAMGNRDKALATLHNLLEIDQTFHAKYKHMFNEFGMMLRKSKMYEEALRFYMKGLEVCQDDENLLFNIARVHLENHNFDNCREYLDRIIEINPSMAVAQKMIDHLTSLDDTESCNA